MIAAKVRGTWFAEAAERESGEAQSRRLAN
jgi:hypothetical protein